MHGLSENDIVERRFDERYVGLMKDLIIRTRALFAEGRPLAKMVDGRLSVDVEMFSRGGLAVLDAIEAIGYDTLHRRPAVNKMKQAALLGRALVAHLAGGNAHSNESAPLLAVVGAQHAAPQLRTSVADSYEECHRIARASHSNFYYAFFLLSKPKRDALAALYAFMRLVDDVSDENGAPRSTKPLPGTLSSLMATLPCRCLLKPYMVKPKSFRLWWTLCSVTKCLRATFTISSAALRWT